MQLPSVLTAVRIISRRNDLKLISFYAKEIKLFRSVPLSFKQIVVFFNYRKIQLKNLSECYSLGICWITFLSRNLIKLPRNKFSKCSGKLMSFSMSRKKMCMLRDCGKNATSGHPTFLTSGILLID